ncbi:hypothetical protein DPMN_097791 [Dreissena polymorpha]|uniref:Uncharacterized protein n=1 Tax=Dreissena polymorpha TaxID=45954 RepID=A0A9D4R618_DREPO|nr:hypothetical protein DPMN_097791 [Dreissena polymorpha]
MFLTCSARWLGARAGGLLHLGVGLHLTGLAGAEADQGALALTVPHTSVICSKGTKSTFSIVIEQIK